MTDEKKRVNMKKFKKKTDTFNFVATKERIDIKIKNNDSETYFTIVGQAEVRGYENEYVSMDDWTIIDRPGILEFIYMDITIRLYFSEEEITNSFRLFWGNKMTEEKKAKFFRSHGMCAVFRRAPAFGFNQEREEREKMNDIISIKIDFEKSVLELKTEEYEGEIPFSEIKTGEENGYKIVEFSDDIKSFVLVINNDGKVIDYFWME